jgi:hypothetical protein
MSFRLIPALPSSLPGPGASLEIPFIHCGIILANLET